jgi:DNA-binding MarR family transcriptional regulator
MSKITNFTGIGEARSVPQALIGWWIKFCLYIQIYSRILPDMKASESRFAHCLYFTAHALARRVERLALESWKKLNLSPSHAYVLLLVLEQPGIQPTKLSRQLRLEPSTITRLIEKLEDRKLVRRHVQGKTTLVYPATAGRKLQPQLKECLEDFYLRYASILGKAKSERVVKQMGRIIDQLEQDTGPGRMKS